MSTKLSRLFGSTPSQRRVRYGILVAAVVAVPLAVAGLVSGAFVGADDNMESIPAVVVNNDEMVTLSLPDGTEQPVLAGRLLVTELTDPDTAGFDWTISNDEEAAELLAAGDAYAVLTIPEDFSASVTSLSGDEPTKANLDIRTDDAHGYLAGSVAQSVGDAMTTTFGRELTQQYLEGFYANLAALGGSLGDAADGAAQVSSGVGSLAGGLGELSNGVAQSAAGATELANGATAYADGVAQYTNGVDGIAGGLGELNAGAAGLDGLSDGWDQYVGVISQVSGQLTGAVTELDAYLAANPEILEQYPDLATYLGYVDQVEQGVSQFATGGQTLAAETRSAIDGIQGGISGLAGGAAELSAGSAGIRDGGYGIAGGVGELAAGLNQLSSGAADAAGGATELAGGAAALADGLATGAEEAKALTDIDAEATADVVAEPVTSTTERDNEIGTIGEVIGMLFAPIGLWLGAMAMFLVFRPFGREALRSTASTGGLVVRTLTRAGAVALAQAVAVVLLLHGALGVAWTLLPQTFAFAALLALAFTAVHAFLTAWLGRAGMLVSLVLVALQLAASGGLYPIEVLSGPFQAISPFLPLTWAVQGMQLIVAGAGGAAVATAAGMVALFGLVGVIGTAVVVGRRRGIRSIGLAATALG
ncbi:YhgE/Pip family protein [Agromyces sp. H66]|uniref:YhgE/Pip family protein n=1 Tax=Agromyces sp. H66 TaxID=2529859 RepID=UPI0010AACFA6|nr:YhgE/Pip family protein [Agromyces sp. H66]